MRKRAFLEGGLTRRLGRHETTRIGAQAGPAADGQGSADRQRRLKPAREASDRLALLFRHYSALTCTTYVVGFGEARGLPKDLLFLVGADQKGNDLGGRAALQTSR